MYSKPIIWPRFLLAISTYVPLYQPRRMLASLASAFAGWILTRLIQRLWRDRSDCHDHSEYTSIWEPREMTQGRADKCALAIEHFDRHKLSSSCPMTSSARLAVQLLPHVQELSSWIRTLAFIISLLLIHTVPSTLEFTWYTWLRSSDPLPLHSPTRTTTVVSPPSAHLKQLRDVIKWPS